MIDHILLPLATEKYDFKNIYVCEWQKNIYFFILIQSIMFHPNTVQISDSIYSTFFMTTIQSDLTSH